MGQTHKIEYKDCANIDTRIEFWDYTYSGSVVECEADDDPLNINIAPMDPTIFIPVIGTGATIKLNSASNMQFTGLYTKDPMKRLVLIYKNNKSLPWWCGYMNPEQYSESYSRSNNYPVIINCNDGFNALNRFKYVDGSGYHYTSLETKWTILCRILTKMGLPFQYLYFASKLSCNGITPDSDKTIFHYLMADGNNYYDEKDEPMTFRQVLEGLLEPYGLQIRWVDGCIWVYEPGMLADSSFSAKRYNSSYAFVDDASVSKNFDISNGDINWDNEDAILDTRSGFSRQKIRYSPYMHQGAIEEIDLTNRDLWSGTESWSTDAYGVPRLSGITGVTGMVLYSGNNAYLKGHRQADGSNEEIYIEKSIDDDGVVCEIIESKRAAMKADQFLLLQADIFIRSKADELGDEESKTARDLIMPFYLMIGDKGATWNPGTSSYDWATGTGQEFYARMTCNYNETVCDTWYTLKAYIPWNIPAGLVKLRMLNPRINLYYASDRLYAADGLIASRLRKIKVRVYKNGGNEAGGLVPGYGGAIEAPDEDKEYKGTLDDDFLNEAQDITLIHADAENITDRGGICKSDGSYTTQWKKTGDSSYYRLVDIKLRAIHSQYQDSLKTLVGTMEADELMGSDGGPQFLHTIQDSDYLDSSKLIFAGGTYNDFKRTLNGTWLEVKQEDVLINVL